MKLSKKFRVLILFVILSLITAGTLGCQSQNAQPKPETKSSGTVMETDVVVVGGGGAGLVAALSAAEKGAQVILLEKMGYMGGATAMSGGIVPAAGTRFQEEKGVKDSPKALARDIFRPAHYSQKAELVDTVANNAKEIIDWMDSLGVKWNLISDSLYNGQTTYRMHLAEGKGAGMTKVLIANIEKNNKITVLLETAGTSIITGENGSVVGVTAKSKEKGELSIKAKSVVLATSGFGANKEMVQKYVPSIAKAYPMVAPGATGEGIVWGQKLGADVANMGAYQGYAPISADTKKALGQTILNIGGILINKDTERFMNEYTGYSELSADLVNQPDAYAYMIFDDTVAKSSQALMEGFQKDKILVSGATAEELAQKLNLDASKLKAEFDVYVKGIEKGEDIFNRTKLPKEWKAPFYAVKVTSDFRHTQGGLVTDTKAHVLKADGSVIKGLFAAGGVTEGFSSAGGPGYMSGNGLLQAFVFGRIAGQEAASVK